MIALVRHDETVINDEDESSNTPLHLAAMEGHSRVVEALIDAGADITARNQSQWTPLDCCAASGYTKTAFALLDNDSAVDPTDKAKVSVIICLNFPLCLIVQDGFCIASWIMIVQWTTPRSLGFICGCLLIWSPLFMWCTHIGEINGKYKHSLEIAFSQNEWYVKSFE